MTRIRRPDGACDFQSGQQRHPHVEQRDLRQEAPEFGKGLFSIVADMDFVAIEPMRFAAVLITVRTATNSAATPMWAFMPKCQASRFFV